MKKECGAQVALANLSTQTHAAPTVGRWLLTGISVALVYFLVPLLPLDLSFLDGFTYVKLLFNTCMH